MAERPPSGRRHFGDVRIVHDLLGAKRVERLQEPCRPSLVRAPEDVAAVAALAQHATAELCRQAAHRQPDAPRALPLRDDVLLESYRRLAAAGSLAADARAIALARKLGLDEWAA